MGTSSKLYTLNNAIFCLDKGVHFNTLNNAIFCLDKGVHFTEIAVECSVSGVCFFIRCWTFDVRCWTFIFQNNPVRHKCNL